MSTHPEKYLSSSLTSVFIRMQEIRLLHQLIQEILLRDVARTPYTNIKIESFPKIVNGF